MLRSRLELGSTVHIHKNEKIQLRATASAEASYPDSAAYLDHSNLLEAIKSRDVWVFSKPHLELKISIRIESSLYDLKGSLDGILKEMKSTLIKSQLWHDLQVSRVSNDDEILTTQEGLYSLNIVFEFQQKPVQFPLPKSPRMPYALNAGSSSIDPPPGLLRISLHDISIFFSFSSSSTNIPDGSLGNIPKCNSFEDLSSILLPQCGHLVEMAGLAPRPDDASIGGSQTTVRSDDGWMSLDYDSPFCSQQTSSDYQSSVIASPQTKCQHVSKATYQPFITLLDSGFRTLLCQTTPRKTFNITTIIEKPGPSLPEFAPSLFTPRYDTSVFQRVRFIPMISKGIAAMLDNVPRPNASIQLKCAAVSSICSDESSDPSVTANDFVNTTNPKSALKTLLWKSMQHRLFNAEAAALQLPSLTTPLKPKYYGISQNPTPANSLAHTSIVPTDPNKLHILHAASISDTGWCFAEDSYDDDALLTDESHADHGDRNTYLTNPFGIRYSFGHDYDNEDDLLDNLPSTVVDKSSPPPSITSILDDDLDMLEEKEQKDNLIVGSPYSFPLQTPAPGQSSTSLSTTTKGTTSISAPASPPSSEMEILDPSSPITILEEPILSPALHTYDAIITDPHTTNLFDTKLTKFPNSNGSGGGDASGIGDVEMLLL
ncbi:hypothetical protein EMCG_05013 [[Emmonsia] crescens]|uniref:Uncharacterized protein n=1 Tax=[Emmonsia] crescens TaxID=73230 RepID=A0A0G2J6R4_9EURO|nr:hypothetical protein EMCG_05013 [Emmonsia crescens UAMH 3008]